MAKTTSTEARAQKRREDLVDAALRVILADGMSGFSSRAVTREAGVNSAMIHYSFDSMDQLLGAVAERCLHDTRQALADVEVQGLALTEAVERLALAYWRDVVRRPDLYRVQLELTLHALATGDQAGAKTQYDGYVGLMADKLAMTCDLARGSLQLLAGTCVGMADGIVVQYLASRRRKRCEQSLLLGVRQLQALLREHTPLTDDAVAELTDLTTWPASP